MIYDPKGSRCCPLTTRGSKCQSRTRWCRPAIVAAELVVVPMVVSMVVVLAGEAMGVMAVRLVLAALVVLGLGTYLSQCRPMPCR